MAESEQKLGFLSVQSGVESAEKARIYWVPGERKLVLEGPVTIQAHEGERVTMAFSEEGLPYQIGPCDAIAIGRGAVAVCDRVEASRLEEAETP